jgi:membrane protease YdiL (CAAX protease family)
VGAEALFIGLGGSAFYNKHQIEEGMAGYQFLALGVAACAFCLLAVRFRLNPAALGYRFPGWKTLLGSAALLPVVLIAVQILWAIFQALLPGYHLQGNTKELLPGGGRQLTPAMKAAVFIWFAVEAPLVEETLFRGILFQGLVRFLTRWLPAQPAVFGGALLSGIVFGLVHGEPHTLPILAFMGIVLAYVFHHTRSIYASALLHGLINGLTVLYVFSTS